MPREEGESYNPRLARMAQLLISETREDSFRVLAAALLISLDPTILTMAPADSETRHLTKSALDLLSHPESNMTTESAALAIALTCILDQTRHLHQSRRSAEQSAHLLQIGKRLLDLPLAEARYNKLQILLTHAISQQERRCTR